MTGGSITQTAGQFFVAAGVGGSGIASVGNFNMSNNAVFNLSGGGSFDVGNAGASGTATLAKMSTLALAAGNIFVGDGGTGQLTMTGLSRAHAQWQRHFLCGKRYGQRRAYHRYSGQPHGPNGQCRGRRKGLCRKWRGAAGTVTMNSGAFNYPVGSASGQWFWIGANGSGVWNQEGGTTTLGNGTAATQLGNGPGSSATLNLDGGVFCSATLKSPTGTPGGAGSTVNINFNGGTLQSQINTVQLIYKRNGTAATFHVNVKSGGAFFDINGKGDTVPEVITSDTSSTLGSITLNDSSPAQRER